MTPMERRVLLASIAGKVFYDVDLDGVIDSGETGLAGWTVFADLNNNGSIDSTTQTYASTDVPKTINDNATVNSVRVISGVSGNVTDVDVTINITHTYVADLDIFLIGPNGTRVELTTDNGGSGDNFTNTIFDDSASTSITSVTSTQAPFSNRYRPEGSLATLNGISPNGTWTLEVTDDAGADVGSLVAWSLTISTGEAVAVSGSTGDYLLPGLPAGTISVRQVTQSGYQAFQNPILVNVPSSGSAITGVNFGNRLPPGVIRGVVFADYNRDGLHNPGEPGLAGRTVYIDSDDDSILDPGEWSTLTDSLGEYRFDNVVPGATIVRAVLPAGWSQTAPTVGSRPASLGNTLAGDGNIPADGANIPVDDGQHAIQSATTPDYVKNEIVLRVSDRSRFERAIKLRANRSLSRAIALSNAASLGRIDGANLLLVPVRNGFDPQKLSGSLTQLAGVRSADLNFIYNRSDPREYTPNDPSYGSQYFHTRMQSNLAWDLAEGAGITVGVTDDGVMVNHPDLYQNIFVNKLEIPASRLANLTDLDADGYLSMIELNNPVNIGSFKANDVNGNGFIDAADLFAPMGKTGGADNGSGGWADGVDGDGNGYIDDLTGWDFTNSTTLGTGDRDPLPASSGDDHGTHVAGIVAARTNNGVGVAGTAGKATIVPLRFYGSGSWTSTVIFNTYKYAADMGLKIVTTSYNVDGFANDSLYASAVQYLYNAGVLHLNSAGNSGAANPARQKYETTLYVASTESSDLKSSFSNYGTGIDISAPGGGIYSTAVGGGTYPNYTASYETKDGTSMATPNAAAVAALIWSKNPTWTRDQVAAQLLATTDHIDGLPGNAAHAGLLGTGRANSFKGVSQTIGAPKLRGVEGLPAEGASSTTAPTSIKVRFFNVLDPATANNTSNYRLLGAGDDDTFDTADDFTIPLSLQSGSMYRVGTNEFNFAISGGMPSSKYRFIVESGGITDPFGNPLDGNGDGTGGDDFVRSFTLVGPTVAYNVSVSSGDDLVLNFGHRDKVAAKVASASFLFSTELAEQYDYDKPMTLPAASGFVVRNTVTNAILPTSAYSVVRPSSNQLKVVFDPPQLPDGSYEITSLGSVIEDAWGNALDGDANNVPGGDHLANFFFIRGDMNRDGVVNNQDIDGFVQGLTDPSGFATAFGYQPTFLGDMNMDGAFNNQDLSAFVSLLSGGKTAASPTFSESRITLRSPTRQPDRDDAPLTLLGRLDVPMLV